MTQKNIQTAAADSWIHALTQQCFLFRGLDAQALSQQLNSESCVLEKLYASRPIYTAHLPDTPLDDLYVILNGGPVVVRSAPLDRVIALIYAGGCFGMLNLNVSYGQIYHGFPSLVEAYKTTDVVKIPQAVIQQLYQSSSDFQARYTLLFELREKFRYHLLNCSTYPPQAVAALLRALIYQERSLGSQPSQDGIFSFDLPIDIVARACQLNHRTVEQVLKGMTRVGLLKASTKLETDLVRVYDPEGMKAVYGATRDKVAWWPLR
ncbi:Crp/Fnr family transcriptional regulator [cf. Phormidesmis sp. LEGE 11477]|uniref:Crp/Fnr family transcriptional regulator n=1 Tax=cf. Phormidesmis sp. LEGE 11477 TaxID=1828680 RepID=UPI0018814A5A|nr:Crp/Fnr family transcriptional regulator [cf. Phormidesmis sp. LEGE 11477]MBE9062492.1 Crp/Fnr family transcriptional regulator [cf. Phormidesmis sp. LEGE 11477]